MLSRLNICSKENKLRQYDHEVKGLSVIKPLVGKDSDVPSDATITFIEYGKSEGLILAEGKNPHYSDIDTYHMAASAVDEAVRRVIAVGGKLPSKETVFYALDNFCWNISSEDSSDGQYKLAQLVRANEALRDYCLVFGIPLISGKDSMKNVWKTNEKIDGKDQEGIISIPPTLLLSVGARIDDVKKAVTMDVKKKGDLVYVIGTTYDELGGSEYYSYIGEKIRGDRYIGNQVPKVDAEEAKRIYKVMSEATEREIMHSIHTPTLGGLGIALAMISFAGGYGMNVDLNKVPCEGSKRNDRLLFSESNSRFIVTIPPEKKEEFEKVMAGTTHAQIGVVTGDSTLRIRGLNDEYIVDTDIHRLKDEWKRPLRDM
jgi:phosphoribosylformylglycinamidine synthase